MNQRETGDLGQGSVGKLLLRLALPTITAQLVNALYNMVDRIYIGHIPVVGRTALTGVGDTSSSTEVLEAPQVDLTSRNMEITGFKFVTISQETEMAGETRQSAQLRICIRDNNQTGLKGGVIFYEVSSQGGIHADYLFDKTGFCDTVVDIDEKYS